MTDIPIEDMTSDRARTALLQAAGGSSARLAMYARPGQSWPLGSSPVFGP